MVQFILFLLMSSKNCAGDCSRTVEPEALFFRISVSNSHGEILLTPPCFHTSSIASNVLCWRRWSERLLYQTPATVRSLPNTRNPNLDPEASVAAQEKLPFFQAKTLNRLIRTVKDQDLCRALSAIFSHSYTHVWWMDGFYFLRYCWSDVGGFSIWLRDRGCKLLLEMGGWTTYTQTHTFNMSKFKSRAYLFASFLDVGFLCADFKLNDFRPCFRPRTWSVLYRLDLHLWPALLPDVLPSFLPPYSSQLGTGPRRTWSAAPQRLHRNSTTAMEFSIFFPGVKSSWIESLHSP